MTKSLYGVSLALLFALPVLAQDMAQTDFNLDYENTAPNSKLPLSAAVWGKDYTVEIDAAVAKSGKQSVLIQQNNTDARFGCIATEIPAVYEGQTITLTGWLKLENVANGNAGLFMRIDGEYDTLEFNNSIDKNIQGTADWTKYEIQLRLPKDARNIYVGALNSGTGKLWVDNLSVTIDGKDLKKAKTKEIVQFPAQKDKVFDGGSTISSIALTPQKIQDLKILGLVWGYLKYYHPAIAAGNYNWDYELFRVLPKILEAKTATERDALLLALTKNLGPFEKSEPENKSDKKATPLVLSPDLEWITTSGLSAELSALLTDLKSAKRTENNYYIGLHLGVNNPDFKNENPYKNMDYAADAGYRLLALYRYWNMIQYYFPNCHLIGEDWKGVLEEFIPKFANAKGEKEYKMTALEIVVRIHDSHAVVNNKTFEEIKGYRFAPDMVCFAEGKPVVYGNMAKTAAGAESLKNGDVITAVNGKPVDKIVEEWLKYTPASNHPTKLRNIAEMLLRSNDNNITVDYLRDGKPYTKSIATYARNEVEPGKYFAVKNDTCFRMLSPKIAYMYPGSVKNEYITPFFKDIKNTDGLVIDLRCYPENFIVFSVGELIAKKTIEYVKWSKPSITTPGAFASIPYVKLKGKGKYNGKVVVLVNDITQSQAEYTAMALRAAGATIIGSTTAGADGDISLIQLPGGISTFISGIGVYYPDGTETQRVGIVPDIEVKPTIKGIAAGRDELLEKAMELINKK